MTWSGRTPTSTVPIGVLVSRLVTTTACPGGSALTTNARSGPLAVATSVGAPSTATVIATVARPIGTTESERPSRLAVMAYSPVENGKERAPGGGDGDAATDGCDAPEASAGGDASTLGSPRWGLPAPVGAPDDRAPDWDWVQAEASARSNATISGRIPHERS